MIALLALAAHAVTPELTVGADALLNDVFVARRGLVVGGGLDLGPPFSVEGMVSYYPNLGALDESAVLGLVLDSHIAPSISRVMAMGRLGFVAWPVRHDGDRFSARIGLAVDAALVSTLDEPVPGLTDDHLSQLHPTADVGLRAEAGAGGPLALRVRVDRIAYRETFGEPPDEGFIERKRGMWLGVDLVWRPR